MTTKNYTEKLTQTLLLTLIGLIFSSVGYAKKDCHIKNNPFAQIDIQKLTKRSVLEGRTYQDLDQAKSESQYEFYKDQNGKSMFQVLDSETSKDFSGQCKTFIRPIHVQSQSNAVPQAELYNPKHYTVLSGGASIAENFKTGVKRIVSTAHQITDMKIVNGDKVESVHIETKIGDVVLMKCGDKSFFAKVKSFGQVRSSSDEIIDKDNVVGMKTDFEDSKDWAKLVPVNSRGEEDLNLIKDLKSIAFMKVLAPNKEGNKSIFAASDKYGYVVQFRGSLNSKDGTHTFLSDKIYRAKSKCRVDQRDEETMNMTEEFYNEANILGIVCDGPVRMASGSPIYLGSADEQNTNNIEEVNVAGQPKVAVGMVVSGDIVQGKTQKDPTKTYINVLVMGQQDIQ